MSCNTLTRSLIATAVAGSLALAGQSAFAVDDASELQLAISTFKSRGVDNGTASGEITYGRYLSDSWQLGVIQGLNYAFINDGDDIWSASTVGFADYHFGDGQPVKGSTVPYAGLFLGAVYNDDDSTGTIGPNLGIKKYVEDSTFINVRYRYEWFFDDLEFGSPSEAGDSFQTVSDNKSDGNHVFSIGLGYRF